MEEKSTWPWQKNTYQIYPPYTNQTLNLGCFLIGTSLQQAEDLHRSKYTHCLHFSTI